MPLHLRKGLLHGRDLGQQRRRASAARSEAASLPRHRPGEPRSAPRWRRGTHPRRRSGPGSARPASETDRRGRGSRLGRRCPSRPGSRDGCRCLPPSAGVRCGSGPWRRWRCRRAASPWCRPGAHRARPAPDCGRRAPRGLADCPRPNRPKARPWRRTPPSAGRTAAGPARRPGARPKGTPWPGSRGRPASRPRLRGCATAPDRSPRRDGT